MAALGLLHQRTSERREYIDVSKQTEEGGGAKPFLRITSETNLRIVDAAVVAAIDGMTMGHSHAGLIARLLAYVSPSSSAQTHVPTGRFGRQKSLAPLALRR